MYIYIYTYILMATDRHRLNGYLAQRVPSTFLASSFTTCVTCEVLKGTFPWRTMYPFSQVPIKPLPIGGISRSDTAAYYQETKYYSQ